MKRATSAGGIVTKKENGSIKICLVKLTPPMSGYVFPKGHLEENESPKTAAIREVGEEIGLNGLKVIEKLGVVTRRSVENDGTEVIKDIHLYLFVTNSYKHDKAEEEYSWFTISEAFDYLTFEEEKSFLEQIKPKFEQ